MTSSGIKIANATRPQVIKGLTNGNTYYFVVTAVNPLGETQSTEVSTIPLAAPTGLVASGRSNQVGVAWLWSPAATSYTIYYGENPNPSLLFHRITVTKSAGTSNGTPYFREYIDGLFNNTTYYVAVAPVKNGHEGAMSSPISAFSGPSGMLGTPQAVTASSYIDNQNVKVTWSDYVPYADYYRLYCVQQANQPSASDIINNAYTTSVSGDPSPADFTFVNPLASGANWCVLTAYDSSTDKESAGSYPVLVQVP